MGFAKSNLDYFYADAGFSNNEESITKQVIDGNSRLEKIRKDAEKIGKEVVERTTDEKGLINKNNLIYWIIGGYIAYRIFK